MAYDPAYLGNITYAGSKGAGQAYILDTIDALAGITAAGYVTDGRLRGMSVGDPVLVRRFNALPAKATLTTTGWCNVSAISAAGAATLVVMVPLA